MNASDGEEIRVREANQQQANSWAPVTDGYVRAYHIQGSPDLTAVVVGVVNAKAKASVVVRWMMVLAVVRRRRWRPAQLKKKNAGAWRTAQLAGDGERDVSSRVYLSRSLDADARTKPLLLAATARECLTKTQAYVRTYVPVERQGERDGTRNETHARASTRLTPRRFFFLFVAARDGEPGAFCSICNLRNLTTANCRRERGLRNFQGRARHRRRQSETYAGRRAVIFLETGGSTRRIGSAKRSSEGLPIRVAWGDFARG